MPARGRPRQSRLECPPEAAPVLDTEDVTNNTSEDGQLATWRREADYWQTRIERSDDQAGGLMTACLTVGAVGTATAGYVQKHAPESRSMAIAGIIVVAVAGL